ncbi:hypothetical protein HIM_04596 [Hirsutella minnesotensis 3608]|uniref:Galactosyl transferase GMA12/MNN10 family protein n=1 Tax=Hirsutella minnesotensis 3608 TaxID=1043627 RepID=A0A0F7ZPV1_9HYPO|nr:hypothetical protein HIM_04596 [Hirsutella minnesotensis 3608]
MATFTLFKIGAGVATIVFILYHFAALRELSISTPAHRDHFTSLPSRSLQIHGAENCVGDINTTALVEESIAIRRSCQKFPAPLHSFGSKGPRVATLSVHFSKSKGSDTFYQQALRSHLLHRLVHQSPLHVLCTPVIEGLWNKQAFILSVLIEEMTKPADERLEWIFWADRDSVVLDHCRDAVDFLEPAKTFGLSSLGGALHSKPINLLIANDHNGLNDGTFLLRVNQWSIDLISDILAFPRYKPDVHLPFSEQTAMEILLKEDRYKDNVRYTPQHWFNAWPEVEGHAQDYVTRDNMSGMEEWSIRRGDFLVHFAGCEDKEREVKGFIEAGRQVGNVWESDRAQRDVSTEVEAFWSENASST